MKKTLALLLTCALSQGAFAAIPTFEPFADASASGGTTYAGGSNLPGQITSRGEKWYTIGSGQTGQAVQIATGSLTVTNGMPAATGNSVLLVAQSGPGGRLNIGTNTSGTLFYSAFIQITNYGSTFAPANTALNGGGAFDLGFNNTTGTDTPQAANPTAIGAPLYMGSSGGGFILGTGRNTGGTGNRFWEANPPHNLGDIIFVVAEYEFVPAATNNDVARLWINPSSSTFGAASYPTPDVIVGDATHMPTSDTDLATINSFVLANRATGSTTQPGAMLVDELRIGTTWAQVTSAYSAPVVVPTLSASVLDPNTVQLVWGTNSVGFTLQATSQLLSSGTSWSTVSGTPTVLGTNYTQTDSISGMKFYRLQH